MQKLFGATISDRRLAPTTVLKFHDAALGLDWMHCGATAKFLGDLFCGQLADATRDRTDALHSINYLTNELMENAVKFRAPGVVEVEARLSGGDTFELWVTNLIDIATAERFQVLLEELVAGDPGDLLIERIEANAANPEGSGSGLGFLTLMNDYGVQLGWSFTDATAAGTVLIQTYAQLELA